MLKRVRVWGLEKQHNRTADWWERLKGERDHDQQEALEIIIILVSSNAC